MYRSTSYQKSVRAELCSSLDRVPREGGLTVSSRSMSKPAWHIAQQPLTSCCQSFGPALRFLTMLRQGVETLESVE
eukprot:2063909-Amphidinium_carterae.1